MIYNLVQLLRDQFPSETFYVNGRILLSGDLDIADRNVLVSETGGTEKPWTRFSVATIQIISRDIDNVKSRKLAYDIHNYLTSRFGMLLPETTIDSVVYPEIKVEQISAIQLPYNLGNDPEGRIEYSTNYEIIVNGGLLNG